MHGLGAQDGDREIDWGKTSADYGTWRPGYPESFWSRLAALEVFRPGERVLDLGTGTGLVARELAARGCRVVGVDVAEPQVEKARELAAEAALDADFRVGPAEETGLPSASFDLITASQCWPYFDRDRMVAEVHRLLDDGGRLMTCHLCWMPLLDDIVRRTEELVLKHSPEWTAAGYAGNVPVVPSWAGDDFRLQATFWYDEPIPFTRERWRGRIRACRAVGASMTPEQVRAFDAEHAELLERIAPEEFTLTHRIDAHVLLPKR